MLILIEGGQIYKLDKNKKIIENFMVGEHETIKLVPDPYYFYEKGEFEEPQISEQFHSWGSYKNGNNLYIYPIYGERLKGNKKPPLPKHDAAVTVNLLAYKNANGWEDIIEIDEDSNSINIYGISLPLVVVTWGIPIIIIGIPGMVIFLCIHKSNKKKKAMKASICEARRRTLLDL